MQNSPIAHQRVLNYAYVDTDTLYQDFQIPQQGYNEKQVEESRIAYGRNVLSGRASDTVLYRLRRAFVNPFTVILFVLAAVSFLTDVVLASNFSRNITTSVIILCMLLLSGIVRFIQELRAKRIADHLTRMVSSTVQVLRNGRWSEISSEKLVVGDKVRLFAGDRIVCFPVGTDGRECDTGEECRYTCRWTGPVLFGLLQPRLYGIVCHRRYRRGHCACRWQGYGLWRIFIDGIPSEKRL